MNAHTVIIFLEEKNTYMNDIIK